MSTVKVRFAPSPTGFLHIGSARTAIFNWLFARHTGGKFLLRVEDTDLKRSDVRFLEEILDDLRWLGLDWDEEPIFQSHRFDVYKEKAEALVAAGKAYRDGEAILFRVEPGRTIELRDMIHGLISFQTDAYKDQVLIKSDGSPAYNFSCVVDDAYLEITHILRGDDHLNTPSRSCTRPYGSPPPNLAICHILGRDGGNSRRVRRVSVKVPGRRLLQAWRYLSSSAGCWTRRIMPLDRAVRGSRSLDERRQAKFTSTSSAGSAAIHQPLPTSASFPHQERLKAAVSISRAGRPYIERSQALPGPVKTWASSRRCRLFFREDFAVEENRPGDREPGSVGIFADRLRLADFHRQRRARAAARRGTEVTAAFIHPARQPFPANEGRGPLQMRGPREGTVIAA
jgi:hypothetical protein